MSVAKTETGLLLSRFANLCEKWITRIMSTSFQQPNIYWLKKCDEHCPASGAISNFSFTQTFQWSSSPLLDLIPSGQLLTVDNVLSRVVCGDIFHHSSLPVELQIDSFLIDPTRKTYQKLNNLQLQLLNNCLGGHVSRPPRQLMITCPTGCCLQFPYLHCQVSSITDFIGKKKEHSRVTNNQLRKHQLIQSTIQDIYGSY